MDNPNGILENDPSLPIVIILHTPFTVLGVSDPSMSVPIVKDISNVLPTIIVTNVYNNNPTKYINPFKS